MEWQTPKTNWTTGDIPVADDFNRIEGNIQELQNTKAVQAELDAHVADNTAHGVNTRMPIAGGTFTGAVTAQSNTAYTTRQIRNIVLSTSNPSGGSNGDIWIKYT
jgi:hypothetical protein